MAIGGYILIITLLILIIYLTKGFNKWFPKDKEQVRRRIERNLRRKDYYDFHNEKIKAEENARQRSFLRNIEGFDLVGNNSNAKRFGDSLK